MQNAAMPAVCTDAKLAAALGLSDALTDAVLLRRLADTAPVLIWQSNADALHDFFNRLWLDFTGRSLEQELGYGWLAGLHPEDAPRCRQMYMQAFAAREPFQIDYRLRRHDGAYRWMLDSGAPRYAPDGGFEGYIGSCIDISDYVALKEAQHGASIEAHSEGPGRSNEFTMRFPATPVALHAPEDASSGGAHAAARRGFRILLIDDNRDTTESMGSLLSLLHYDVRTAMDARTGLQLAIQFEPQLILCDIGLPDMDGYQLAPALREAAEGRKMVLVAASGYGMASDRARSLAAGFDYHLAKPIDADALLDFLAQQAASF